MRRLLCLIVLSAGVAHQASAQQAAAPQLASDPWPASATLPAAAASPPQSEPSADNQRIVAYLTHKFGVAKEKAIQLAGIVSATAQKYSLPPAMVYAIISIESRFKEKALGPRGATGLMQVVPSVHHAMLKNVKDLTEPNANVDAGSKILSGYLRSAGGDMDAALKVYGGSRAYAAMVQQRVETFRHVLEPRGAAVQFTTGSAPGMSAPTPTQTSASSETR